MLEGAANPVLWSVQRAPTSVEELISSIKYGYLDGNTDLIMANGKKKGVGS